MRAFKVICGIAILFMALHMVHAIHLFMGMRNEMSAAMWLGLTGIAVVADALSIVGGLFLIAGK